MSDFGEDFPGPIDEDHYYHSDEDPYEDHYYVCLGCRLHTDFAICKTCGGVLKSHIGLVVEDLNLFMVFVELTWESETADDVF